MDLVKVRIESRLFNFSMQNRRNLICLQKIRGDYPRVDPPISQSIWSMRRIDAERCGARTSRNLIRGQKKRGDYRHRTLAKGWSYESYVCMLWLTFSKNKILGFPKVKLRLFFQFFHMHARSLLTIFKTLFVSNVAR